jgi:hypothetical protein
MVKTSVHRFSFLFILISVSLGLGCGKTESKNLYKMEDVEPLNQQIRSTPDLQLDADKIARLYYSQLYPNFNNTNLTVSTRWKDNYLFVELVEVSVSDPEIEAIKVAIVFDRPMGRLHVHEIKHSWKCKYKSVFSGEPCKRDAS